ncbi:hypothetical protein DFJ73DRAFT_813323 [Zopfochytrium polystomum]|nr:hypothetical protein DFJ73DRAFT_813323 [Zopfochytrium polystomum]
MSGSVHSDDDGEGIEEYDDDYDDTLLNRYQQAVTAMASNSTNARRFSQGSRSSALQSRRSSFNQRPSVSVSRFSSNSYGPGQGERSLSIVSRSGGGRRASIAASMSLTPMVLRRLNSRVEADLINIAKEDSAANADTTISDSLSPVIAPDQSDMDGEGNASGLFRNERLSFFGRRISVGLNTPSITAELGQKLKVEGDTGGPTNEAAKAEVDSNVFESALGRVFRRKEIFVQLSFIFGVFLFFVVTLDYVALLRYEAVLLSAQWLISLLFLHVTSIYLFLLAFVYANAGADSHRRWMAVGAGALNLTAFIIRAVLEIVFSGYKPL